MSGESSPLRTSSLSSTHTNPECGVGVNVQIVIGELFEGVQHRAEETMASVTLAEIIRRFEQRANAEGAKGACAVPWEIDG